MGHYEGNANNVHYFVRNTGVWQGVPDAFNTEPSNVDVIGNSNFIQSVANDAPRSGKILGWFA